jgi:polyhydroxybutyrate depolymerase
MPRPVRWLLLALGGIAVILGLSARQPYAHTVARELEVGGLKRNYLVHVPVALPKDKAVPVVLVFHGGSGDGAGTERITRFSALADREGFLVVYPNGIGKNWNDGRIFAGSEPHRRNIDDVAFIARVIDAVAWEHPIDPKRIYATGISNGGIFSHYLAAHLSSRIAAIAPVVGGIADPFYQRFRPEKPVSVFIIQGRNDPLVPYQAGGISEGKRGKVISTDEAIRKWVLHDGCSPEPVTGRLPDKDPKDGCTVTWSTWSKGRDGTEVMLYNIAGGGHTWPGGPQYLPERLIGKVCRDFDATEVIWDFFKRHPKP